MSLDCPRFVLSDPEGKIFDHPYLKLAGRSGDREQEGRILNINYSDEKLNN